MQKVALSFCRRSWQISRTAFSSSQTPGLNLQESSGNKWCKYQCAHNLSSKATVEAEDYSRVRTKDSLAKENESEEVPIFTARPELIKALETQRALSPSEWTKLKSELISGGRSITERSFEGNVMGGCVQYKNYAAGKSLMNYLRNNNTKPNIATLSRYMRVCGECFNQSGEEEIINCYKELRKMAPILDAASLEHVIFALANTSMWKECLNLMEEIKVSSMPRGRAYNRVATAAFANNEIDLGWSLLETRVGMHRQIMPDAFLQWLQLVDKASNNVEANEKLNKFLEFCSQHQLSLPMEVTEELKHHLLRRKTEDWLGDYTTIKLDGTCERCHSRLESLQINEEEFTQLREVFLKNVITGDDPYSKTSPQEIKKFKYFISKTSPYDVVIDGLNVAFYGATKKTTSKEKAKLLHDMVRDLIETKKARILVLGRAHMFRWPQQFMSYIKNNAHCFFLSNLSEDDPLLLYAAMHSGLGTCVVSRDLMRDHKYCLHNEQLSTLFRRWQLCHQLGFSKNPETGKFKFTPPVTYNPVAQKTKDSLHIPCSESALAVYSCDLPARWLCMSKSRLPCSESINTVKLANSSVMTK